MISHLSVVFKNFTDKNYITNPLSKIHTVQVRIYTLYSIQSLLSIKNIENLHLLYHYDHRYPSWVLAQVHLLHFDRYSELSKINLFLFETSLHISSESLLTVVHVSRSWVWTELKPRWEFLARYDQHQWS